MKFLLVCTRDLTLLFERHLPAIATALDQFSLVELDWQMVKGVA